MEFREYEVFIPKRAEFDAIALACTDLFTSLHTGRLLEVRSIVQEHRASLAFHPIVQQRLEAATIMVGGEVPQYFDFVLDFLLTKANAQFPGDDERMEALLARRLLGFLREGKPVDFFYLLNRLCTNDVRHQILCRLHEAFPQEPAFQP